MKNEFRYIDLGTVSKEMYAALWEYDNVIDLKDPILIKFSTNKTLVSFFQGPYWDKELKEWKNLYTDLTNYFYSPELSDIDKLRYYQKVEINYDADLCYYVESPNVTNFIYFFPDGGRIEEDKNKRILITDLFMDTVKEILAETNIGETKRKGNDIFFKSGGNLKKYLGNLYRPSANNWGYCDISITYDFDFEVANRVRTFDSKVKVKKFEVDDIKDMVGGLWEVDPTIDKDELDLEVVTRVSKKLGLSIKNDSLTGDEMDKLFERGHRRLTEEQWYLYGNNDGFEIRY